MKNIVSLLAVALFATVFAVGCGKYDKCVDAKKDECGKNDKFVDALKDKCKWVGDDKTGKCEEVKAEDKKPDDKKPDENKPVYNDTADKKVCTDVALAGTDPAADKTACESAKVSADGTKAGKVCVYTPASGTGTAAVVASCSLGDKPAQP